MQVKVWSRLCSVPALDLSQPVESWFHDRRFANLMELYDQNYQLLMRLLPGVRQLNANQTAEVDGHPELHLQVLVQHRYTTDLRLVHDFDEAGDHPDMLIRAYHDSAQASIIESAWQPPAALASQLARLRELDKPLQLYWASNLFLHRWLEYCLQRGYRFPDIVPATESGEESRKQPHKQPHKQPGTEVNAEGKGSSVGMSTVVATAATSTSMDGLS